MATFQIVATFQACNTRKGSLTYVGTLTSEQVKELGTLVNRGFEIVNGTNIVRTVPLSDILPYDNSKEKLTIHTIGATEAQKKEYREIKTLDKDEALDYLLSLQKQVTFGMEILISISTNTNIPNEAGKFNTAKIEGQYSQLALPYDTQRIVLANIKAVANTTEILNKLTETPAKPTKSTPAISDSDLG